MSVGLATVTILASLVFVAALYQDLTTRRIPNVLPAVLLVIGAAKWLLVGRLADLGQALAAAAIMLVVTALMFWRGWMGGGDVKLLTAASFLIGGAQTPEFVILTALAGGIVALLVLVWTGIARLLPARAGTEGPVELRKATVPYGVAISSAAVWILYHEAFLFEHWTLR